jgi:hypothetical protein
MGIPAGGRRSASRPAGSMRNNRARVLKLAAASLSMLAVAACGGGGGAPTDDDGGIDAARDGNGLVTDAEPPSDAAGLGFDAAAGLCCYYQGIVYGCTRVDPPVFGCTTTRIPSRTVAAAPTAGPRPQGRRQAATRTEAGVWCRVLTEQVDLELRRGMGCDGHTR